MISSGHFKTAVDSLRASRARSLLTMMGIIIGITAVITLISLGEGLRNKIDSQINQLGDRVITVRSGSLGSSRSSQANYLALLNASTLTKADVDTISHTKGIQAVAPMAFVTNVAATGSKTINNVSVIGTSGNLAQMLKQKLDYGIFFQDSWNNPDFAVIGPFVAHQLFGELNPIGRSINIAGISFRVSGELAQAPGGLFSVAETDFNSAIFIPTSVAYTLSRGSPNIIQILAQPAAGVSANQAIASISQALLKTHGQRDFSVLKQDDLLRVAGGIIDTLTNFISAIAAISLLVGGIGIMDILLVSVSERTREIGIRKAVGATDRQIMNQFLIEGLVLSVTGGLIGIMAAYLINGLLRLYTSLQPSISLLTVGLAASVIIAIGIVFSAAPALKAARKDPIDALRHE